MNAETVYRDISLLDAEFGRRCNRLNQHLTRAYETGVTKTHFKIFETFRSPVRQASLLKKGTTKASAWESPHQYGLACDFVPYRDGVGWNWDAANDYRFLATSAKTFNLIVPISWDPCHVEHPSWRTYRVALAKLRSQY